MASKNRHTIDRLFDMASGRYERTNTWMSIGLHHLWRYEFVRAIIDSPLFLRSCYNVAQNATMYRYKHYLACHDALLSLPTWVDVAGGRGDVARLAARMLEGKISMSVVDPSLMMMRQDFTTSPVITRLLQDVWGLHQSNMSMGANCDNAYSLQHAIHFVAAEGECLPYASSTLDVISCAFGFRNISRRMTFLQECLRVLKPQGTLHILEFVLDAQHRFYTWHRGYVRFVLPYIGGLISGEKEPYQYLSDSIMAMPSIDSIEQMLQDVGFDVQSTRSLEGFVHHFCGLKSCS